MRRHRYTPLVRLSTGFPCSHLTQLKVISIRSRCAFEPSTLSKAGFAKCGMEAWAAARVACSLALLSSITQTQTLHGSFMVTAKVKAMVAHQVVIAPLIPARVCTSSSFNLACEGPRCSLRVDDRVRL